MRGVKGVKIILKAMLYGTFATLVLLGGMWCWFGLIEFVRANWPSCVNGFVAGSLVWVVLTLAAALSLALADN